MSKTMRASAVAVLGKMRILGGFEEAAGRLCFDCEEVVVGSGLVGAFAFARVVRGAIVKLRSTVD